jgi:signal transduction histidine kinase
VNLAVAIALFSLAAQLSIAGAMLMISRAPGWERVRVMVLVAFSAALYNAVDVWATAGPRTLGELGWILRANTFHAAIHISAWLWYTFADETGRWSRLPAWTQRLAIATLLMAAFGSLSGLIVSTEPPVRVLIPSLGVDYTQPKFSAFGNLVSLWLLGTLGVSCYEHFKRARRGVPGSKGLLVGFTLFLGFAIEEALVTAGVINFLFLADIGYLCVVVPIGVLLGRRFVADAYRLREMGQRLAIEVEARTSERDAAREALIEQERLAALGRLAAGVGHEINNPLQYLVLSLDELRETSGPLNAVADEALDNAMDGAERIRRVVEGLRVYSRGAAESYSDVDIATVVEHAMRVAAAQFRGRVRVSTQLDATPTVLGDESRLVQVVVNPLVNAAQALMAAGVADPRIAVNTGTTPDGAVEIEICDNGPGFRTDLLPQLGTPYLTTKAQAGGTGLGLFVSRGIVEAHGGRLLLDNAPGGGARVRIVLPAQSRAPEVETSAPDIPVRIPTPAPTRTTRRHVLVVDDEEAVRSTLARGLGARGYRVTTASDGLEALRRLDEQEIDIVVSDLMMPRMSGIELAEALAVDRPSLRRTMIVITGGAISPAAEAFVQRDDVVVLQKPIGIAQLAGAIDRAS